jgi:dephospho-CoA kinase
MILCGITGGIASGKSTVSKTLINNGVFIIDADQVSRDVVVPGSKGLQLLIDEFGIEILSEDGSLNRKHLGDLVFDNSVLMDSLNKIMIPLIDEESSKQIRYAQYQGCSIICYDSALVCEFGHADKYRPLIAVQCSEEQQIERLMKRGTGHGSLTREQAMARINAQMPVPEKVAMADWIIDSSYSIDYSIKQTETIYLCLKILLRDQVMVTQGKR